MLKVSRQFVAAVLGPSGIATAKRWRARIKSRIGPQVRLHTYPDYETYRREQQAGNERKLGQVFAQEANIAHIVRYLEAHIGEVHSVLCHGTRNGAELGWFRASLRGTPTMLGTDISTTASRFPDTIVWDFHEMKPEWRDAWDVVYSNSWDHSLDPGQAIRHWLESLTPNGRLVLEHSQMHEPDAVNQLDPFGATITGLSQMVNDIDPQRWQVLEVIPLPAKDRHALIAGRRRA